MSERMPETFDRSGVNFVLLPIYRARLRRLRGHYAERSKVPHRARPCEKLLLAAKAARTCVRTPVPTAPTRTFPRLSKQTHHTLTRFSYISCGSEIAAVFTRTTGPWPCDAFALPPWALDESAASAWPTLCASAGGFVDAKAPSAEASDMSGESKVMIGDAVELLAMSLLKRLVAVANGDRPDDGVPLASLAA